jgi:hypothetical protein
VRRTKVDTQHVTLKGVVKLTKRGSGIKDRVGRSIGWRPSLSNFLSTFACFVD